MTRTGGKAATFLTVRDCFALEAMKLVVTSGSEPYVMSMPKLAYQIADAMMKERDRDDK